MIIVNIKGGLGNQMFEYACGRAVALRYNNTLKLDTTGFVTSKNSSDTFRNFALSVFSINASIASLQEIHSYKYPYGIISKGWRFFRLKILRQYDIHFKPNILLRKNNTYLDGFFQSEKYFKDFEVQIRQDFTLREPVRGAAQFVLERIQNSAMPVSVHIRRGDYVSNSKINDTHGTCSPQYYARALSALEHRLGTNIQLFVFSDDIAWVKENMSFTQDTVFVSNPEIKDYEELFLMSQCAHNVIANSSFSWWAAWLNQNPEKIVIAPQRWVLKNEHWFRDIIPSSWIRL